MSGIDPSYMMNLVEGKFAGTSRKHLTDLFTAYKNGPNKTLLIHFHGGLIGQQDGIKGAVDP